MHLCGYRRVLTQQGVGGCGDGRHGRDAISWVQERILIRRTAILALVVLLGSTIALGGVTGSISGIVRDAAGAVVPGATVTVTSNETGIQRVVATETNGGYSFLALPVGTYVITVRKNGFKEYEQTGIAIDANSAVRVDARLELGTVHEEVRVSGTAVRVETTNTQMGEVIGSSKMTSLPLPSPMWTPDDRPERGH